MQYPDVNCVAKYGCVFIFWRSFIQHLIIHKKVLNQHSTNKGTELFCEILAEYSSHTIVISTGYLLFTTFKYSFYYSFL